MSWQFQSWMFIQHTSVTCVPKDTYKNAKSSIILNNSKLETIQKPIKKRMNN